MSRLWFRRNFSFLRPDQNGVWNHITTMHHLCNLVGPIWNEIAKNVYTLEILFSTHHVVSHICELSFPLCGLLLPACACSPSNDVGSLGSQLPRLGYQKPQSSPTCFLQLRCLKLHHGGPPIDKLDHSKWTNYIHFNHLFIICINHVVNPMVNLLVRPTLIKVKLENA